MDNNLLYNLMMKRLAIFNIGFILLISLFMLGVPSQIVIWFLLSANVLAIIIQLVNKTNYPVYCYIYTPFKNLFEYEDKIAKYKYNKNIYYILLVPLILFSFIKIPSNASLSMLKLPFIIIFLSANVSYIIKMRKYRMKNLV